MMGSQELEPLSILFYGHQIEARFTSIAVCKTDHVPKRTFEALPSNYCLVKEQYLLLILSVCV